MQYLIYFILIAVCIFFINKFLSQFKFPKIGAVGVFTGGVKSGKSAISLACAYSNYKRAVRSWKFTCFFIKIINAFRKDKLSMPERPLFYSTIPLRNIPYILCTRDYLLRKRRFSYGSVVFIDEASLVADSQLIKDNQINTELLLFFKLFGHETKGGKCIVNTHCITDLHFALKRCTSQYFYIHSLSKYIPFFSICNMREERYSEDGTTLNTYGEDVEDTTKRCLMSKKTFKRYDSFCYSYLTDHLPTDKYSDCIIKGKYDSLKSNEIVSFRREFANLATRQQIEDEQTLLKKHLEELKKNA